MSNEPMFSVSDIVRVKSVEQLVSEFGECIDVPSYFTTSMRQFCGNSYVIKDIYKRLDGLFSYLLEGDEIEWHFDECVLLFSEDEQSDADNFDTSFDIAMGWI